ncbi:astacin-like [Anopheles bellator]|uniref:astacin-like n=1 Tax=Anopheles bellator TaxID=139047 RepID=UPI0026473D05|nr:astacin-like [Anopheles bellator]
MALLGTLLVICCYCCWSALLGVVARTSIPRYHSESPEVGRLVQRYDGRHDHRRPHELGFGYYYQGDIMLPEQQSVDRVSLSNKFPSSLWPNGVVPYYFAPDTFKPNEIYMIEKAMDEFHRQTCVRFVPRTPQTPYYVTITNRETGCFASIGRRENNGQNLLNLQTPNCLYGGTPVHEMMHVLGFLHEVSRADRDEYIHIDRSALARQYQTGNFFTINFGKDVDGSTTTYNISYNYDSIMHYSKTAGSVDGRKQVLFNLRPYAKEDFGSDRLTPPDIESVKYRYCRGSSGGDDAICKYKKGENIEHQLEHLTVN